MKPPVDFRPVGAALLILAVLAGTYEAACQLPQQVAARRPLATAVATDTTIMAGVAPSPITNPEPEPGPPRTADWEFRRSHRLLERSRRYVGTVGGEPATAVLYQQGPDSTVGYFYRWRRAEKLTLHLGSRHARPGWQVRAEQGPPYERGRWLLSAPARPGTLLRGVWLDPAGRRQPFALRESYRGAVRYELVEETYASPHEGGSEYSCVFLHLLGPAAAHPPLSRLQWPGQAARRRDMLADRETGDRWHYELSVGLNGFGLLSYSTFEYTNPFRGTVGNGTDGTFLFDLTTGRELTLASQLRPGYKRPLRQQLTQKFLHDPDQQARNQTSNLTWRFSSSDDHDQFPDLAPLPDPAEGCLLNASGLRIALSEGRLVENGFYGYQRAVLIPYAELRPLVRPGTPLARMLRARGLW